MTTNVVYYVTTTGEKRIGTVIHQLAHMNVNSVLNPPIIVYRDNSSHIQMTKFPPNEGLFPHRFWQFQFSCVHHCLVNIVRTMQRLFASFTKPTLLSMGTSRGINSIIVSPAASFLQCMPHCPIYYLLVTTTSFLGFKTLFPAFSLIAQSCVSPLLDNGLIFVGRPRRMPKKVND